MSGLWVFGRNKSAWIMVAFLMGIAIHSFFPLTPVPTIGWWVAAVMSFLVCLIVLMLGSSPRMTMMVICLVSCLFGLWRFDASLPRSFGSTGVAEYRALVHDVTDGLYGPQAIAELKTSLPSFNKEVADSPLAKGGNEGGLMVQLSLKTTIPIGSTINFSCSPRPVEPKKDETDARFAGRLHKAQAQCTPKDLLVIKSPAWWDVRQTFADLRVWTNRRIMSVLPGDEGALIAGMLYGERGMSQKSNDLFRRAGLTHLIAVSGSNITIVASIIFTLLLGAGLWRRQAFWFTTLTLLAYVMFTGFSASVARAAVMGWLVLLARHIGRQPRTWHVLLVSAFVLCLVDPWMLAFDAGFALSFLATIGLMVWSPIFNHGLEKLSAAGPGFLPQSWAETLREVVATTLAATLMTTPYMAFAFGRISLAGLVTNLVAVPLVPWAMLFGAVAAAWGQMLGWGLTAAPALGVARVIFMSARLADFFPWLNVPMQNMNLLLLAATYGLLLWIWFWLRAKNDFSTEKSSFCQK